MKIEDFNNLKPFDRVWLMDNNKPHHAPVDRITLTQNRNEPVKVFVNTGMLLEVDSSFIFKTKYELLQYVFGELELSFKEGIKAPPPPNSPFNP